MKIPSVGLGSIGNLSIANMVNLTHTSWNLLVGILFAIVVLIYAISFGRNKAIIALVSMYMGFSATLVFPLEQFKLADILLEGFYLHLTVFSFFTILAFLLFSNSFLQRIFGYARARGGKWWQIIISSFLHVGLLTMIILSFLSEEATANLSPMVQLLFISDWVKFVWIILPILALIFLKQDSY